MSPRLPGSGTLLTSGALQPWGSGSPTALASESPFKNMSCNRGSELQFGVQFEVWRKNTGLNSLFAVRTSQSAIMPPTPSVDRKSSSKAFPSAELKVWTPSVIDQDRTVEDSS